MRSVNSTYFLHNAAAQCLLKIFTLASILKKGIQNYTVNRMEMKNKIHVTS